MLNIDFKNSIIAQDMADIDNRLCEKEKLFGKSIFVSGASGMIASYFVAYLIWLNKKYDAGIHIYAGIRNKDKAKARFGQFMSKKWFRVIDTDVVAPLMDDIEFDYIIHAASLASPQYYGKYPVETMLPNVVGTYNILEYARRNNVAGVLFFSSGSVYGTIKEGKAIYEDICGVMDFLSAGNEYGESKRCGETLCKAYAKEYAIPVKMARIHHTYGPTLDIKNDTRVFSEFTGNIVRGEDIVMKSSGSAKRAFCYISDTIVGLFKILLIGKTGEAYNVGNPNEYISIAELAQTLLDLFPEKKLKVKFEKRQDKGYNSSPEQRILPLNVDKLKGIGWENTVDIREGFRRTVQGIEYMLSKHIAMLSAIVIFTF